MMLDNLYLYETIDQCKKIEIMTACDPQNSKSSVGSEKVIYIFFNIGVICIQNSRNFQSNGL